MLINTLAICGAVKIAPASTTTATISADEANQCRNCAGGKVKEFIVSANIEVLSKLKQTQPRWHGEIGMK